MSKSSTAGNLPAIPEQFEIMNKSPEELQNIIDTNLNGVELSASDLEQVSVPAGGGTTWHVETVDGSIETRELIGIIIHVQTVRAYWPEKYDGGGTPPQCFSTDGLVGVGDPGGNCHGCMFNEFGSAENGQKRGKACTEKRLVFMVTENELLPVVIRAPAMSLKNSQKYLVGLTSRSKAMYSVYTKLTLEKDKNQDGISYSKIIFQKVADVENPAHIEKYAKSLKTFLRQHAAAAVQQRDPENGYGDEEGV